MQSHQWDYVLNVRLVFKIYASWSSRSWNGYPVLSKNEELKFIREIYWKFIRNMCQCGKFQATLDVEWTSNDKENKKLQYVYEIYVYEEQLQIFVFSFWLPAFALYCLLWFFQHQQWYVFDSIIQRLFQGNTIMDLYMVDQPLPNIPLTIICKFLKF